MLGNSCRIFCIEIFVLELCRYEIRYQIFRLQFCFVRKSNVFCKYIARMLTIYCGETLIAILNGSLQSKMVGCPNILIFQMSLFTSWEKRRIRQEELITSRSYVAYCTSYLITGTFLFRARRI